MERETLSGARDNAKGREPKKVFPKCEALDKKIIAYNIVKENGGWRVIKVTTIPSRCEVTYLSEPDFKSIAIGKCKQELAKEWF